MSVVELYSRNILWFNAQGHMKLGFYNIYTKELKKYACTLKDCVHILILNLLFSLLSSLCTLHLFFLFK